MNKVLKKTLLSTLVVPFALGAQSASAALISNWGYSAESEFTASSFTPADGIVDGQIETTPTSLSWGDPDDDDERSSLTIGNVSSPSGLMTNAATPTAGGALTHFNNSIDSRFQSLTGFTLQSTLTLEPFPQTTPNLTQVVGPLSFVSSFTETTNQAPCEVVGDSVCDDVFVLGNPEDLGATATATGYQFAQQFDFEDITYTVFLELIGVGVLNDDACEAALGEGATGCVGFLTQEGQENVLETQFRITANVPEPGTLALLGLGLAGLGLSRRKKTARS